MSPIPTWEQAVAAHEQYLKLSPEQKRLCDTTGTIHKLALACVEELRNQSKREGMLSNGGLFGGQWCKDDVTLSFNLTRVKKNCRLIPRSGLLKCIQRWLKLYPQLRLFTLSEIKSYPVDIRSLINIEPKAKIPSSPLTDSQFLGQVKKHLGSILMEPSKVARCKELASKIEGMIVAEFKSELKVFVTGSLETGLLTRSSDLDLNISLPKENPSFDEVEAYIKVIGDKIRKMGMNKVYILHRKGIRVPLIKFEDPQSEISVDISFGKSTTIFKTALLAAYARIDPTVRDLLLFVKSWAGARGVNQAVDGTINTYCHSTLMLAYLIMVGAIPNLQRICSRHTLFQPFGSPRPSRNSPADRCLICNQILPTTKYFNFNVYFSLTPIKLSQKLNFLNLLEGFMGYFGHNFQSKEFAISLRLGHLVRRADIGHGLTPLLVVEDPIDSSVNVAASARPWCLDWLVWEFRRCSYLVQSRQPISVILAPFKQPPHHAFISRGIYTRHTLQL
ncbi:hypothetical protein L0F63_003167 [Massospora cicadina]|nr:hypothetical protein L0F63_003167 [Massospora cicadina]